MKRIAVLGVLLLAGLTGCASVRNTSLLDGSRTFGRTELHTYPVRVLAIDGQYTIDDPLVRVEPGAHVLRVSAPPAVIFTQPAERDVPFTVQACKRYYLVAKRDNPYKQDFELVVQQVETRTDCHSS
ncbi:hypothetical protein [Chitinimonas sp. BJB300]|uniref:hypothetical protein n=1 Tax=Chitinimonas sp. BJB300 TaxID=1559339 RepID=UPI000C107C70|nr:hypothetical protein [Chitinimonas sp. BJB300]PHV11710.1 hypothetical protein CSQ89_09335 [Chitinimonas sp. BJB300]TSJ89989.1 hypothetical protein FG002_007300 [Chitinimonas sp. BJB300]